MGGMMDSARSRSLFIYIHTHKCLIFSDYQRLARDIGFFGGSVRHLTVQSSEYDITTTEPTSKQTDT